MAESLERCFNRALLKHFPSEDGDTDEDFHVSKEEKERKEKKRTRSSKSVGPESLIRATDQVQRKRSSRGDAGSAHSEDEYSKPTRLPPPPHWTNGPRHPQGLPPNQHHPHGGGLRAMYHPGQQVKMGAAGGSLLFLLCYFSPKRRDKALKVDYLGSPVSSVAQ